MGSGKYFYILIIQNPLSGTVDFVFAFLRHFFTFNVQHHYDVDNDRAISSSYTKTFARFLPVQQDFGSRNYEF
jgi:hypothetical protein